MTEDKWIEARKIAREGIQHFEGCRLTSYVLHGESWATIGWGKAIPLGEHPKHITQAEADRLLDEAILARQKRLQSEVPAAVLDKLSAVQLAGLLIFRYNVKDSTWLNAKCHTRLVLAQGNIPEFVKWHRYWVNGEAGPLPGLKRRRRVERELMQGKPLDAIKKANWYQGEYR